ncbi:PilT/PilU family type 4a pilus ATPase [bacterium]|nr:PilT/PilU family type 4a pilus ATPase [bacterium]
MDMRQILRTARKLSASDIHIVAGLPPAFRLDGDIALADTEAMSRDDTRRLTMELLTDEQKAVLESERELCFSLFDDAMGRFRVNAYYHAGNPELAIRLCGDRIPEAGELGLPAVLADLARRTNGLVIITGPTGMGKTTTLNYMVDLINRERRCKIVTIEDPVEYVHQPKQAVVVQQEIHLDSKSFSRALRHVLRQDPDVIAVGEMRDYETVSTALNAAETGHLVLTTLHTPSAVQTVERIIGVFPAAQQQQAIIQVAASLQGIVAQRLLPMANRKGRVLATEVLVATTAARRIIRENECHRLATVIETGQQYGMQSMDACLLGLYERGDISYEVAVAHAHDPSYIPKRF